MPRQPSKLIDFTDRMLLSAFVGERLKELRESLEAIGIDQRLADYYRGHIAMLKEIQETFIE